MQQRFALIFWVIALLLPSAARAAFQELAPTTAPYTFIVRVISTEAGGIERHCTGTLITEAHVLTAAHCVEHAHSSIIETTGGDRIRVSELLIADGWTEAKNKYAHDIAILRLTHAASTWNEIQAWDDSLLTETFWSAGYPVRNPEMHVWMGTLDALLIGVAYQQQTAQPGMSGAPLIYGNMIVGVHSHRLGESTGYTLLQQALLDQFADELRRPIVPAAPPLFQIFVPFMAR